MSRQSACKVCSCRPCRTPAACALALAGARKNRSTEAGRGTPQFQAERAARVEVHRLRVEADLVRREEERRRGAEKAAKGEPRQCRLCGRDLRTAGQTRCGKCRAAGAVAKGG